MTLCVGWIRKMKETEEICLASDSMFAGGGSRLPIAPKLFPILRGDCAIACAGNTGYTMPLVEHINHAVEINGPIRDRAYDFFHFIHLVEDVINSCLYQEKEIQENDSMGRYSVSPCRSPNRSDSSQFILQSSPLCRFWV